MVEQAPIEEHVPFLSEDKNSLTEEDRDGSSTAQNPFRARLSIFNFILLVFNVCWFVSNSTNGHSTQFSLSKKYGMCGLLKCVFSELIYQEPSGAPTEVEDVRWNLSLATRSAFTSMDRRTADAAWDSISMTFKRKPLNFTNFSQLHFKTDNLIVKYRGMGQIETW